VCAKCKNYLKKPVEQRASESSWTKHGSRELGKHGIFKGPGVEFNELNGSKPRYEVEWWRRLKLTEVELTPGNED